MPAVEAKKLAKSINDELVSMSQGDGQLPEDFDFKIVVLRKILKFYEAESEARQKL